MAPANLPTIAAVVLTRNEQDDLPACLESLAGLLSQIIVVDSYSTDRTVEIAQRYGCQVLSHPFHNYATQFNWALRNITSTVDWVVRIDADEQLSHALRQEVRELLPTLADDITGLLVPRRICFLGKHISHGDSYPIWLLRFFRNGVGVCEDTWMDEHIVLSRGKTVKLKGDLIHHIPKTLSEWTHKHDSYAGRECKDILAGSETEHAVLASRQVILKRLLKKRIYLQLPPFFRAFAYWFYRYFLRLGFLDGPEGLIYHFLQAFWYRFLVDAKLFELQKRQTHLDTHTIALPAGTSQSIAS